MNKKSYQTYLCLSLGMMIYLAYVLATVFIQKRPYYHAIGDAEHAYFYFAKMIDSGDPFLHPHPGTMVAYGFWLLWKCFSLFSNDLQLFFNFLYLSVTFLNVISIFLLVFKLGKNYQLFVASAVLLICAHPSLLYYSTYFSTDSLYLVLTLPFVTIASVLLNRPSGLSILNLVLMGLYAGFLTAIKFNHAPLSAAFILMIAMKDYRQKGYKKAIYSIMILSVAMVSSFLLNLLPVFDQVPMILAYIFHFGSAVGSGVFKFEVFFMHPVFTMIGLTLFFSLLYLPRMFKNNEPELVYFILFLILSFFYLSYKGVRDCPGKLSPEDLRNAGPYLLALVPIAVALKNCIGNRCIVNSKVTCTLLIMLLVGTILTYTFNEKTLSLYQDRELALKEYVETELKACNRIAVWDGFHSGLGASKFHLWGNYRYGRGIFDEALATEFPKWSLFDFRQVPSKMIKTEAQNEKVVKSAEPKTKKITLIGLFFGLWHRFFPLNKEVFIENGRGSLFSSFPSHRIDAVIAYLDDEDSKRDYDESLLLETISKVCEIKDSREIMIGARPAYLVNLQSN